MLARPSRPLLALLALGVVTALVAMRRPPEVAPQNDLLNATLWAARSVEYKANALALFQLADLRLDAALADPAWTAVDDASPAGKPAAIIADVDETLLDNSPYQAWLVRAREEYAPETFDAWTRDAAAPPVPGAVEFTRRAAERGVTVFYVTNREASQEDATRSNMAALGFPIGDGVDTFLMSGERPDWTSRKGTRRAFVARDYRVLLLLGDNYGDFSDDFALPLDGRLASFERHRTHFGRDWLMLANPQYGSFESAPFDHDRSFAAGIRRQRKVDALPDWTP